MAKTKRDFIAEGIADYEGQSEEEQGKLLVSILEEQPYLMGFVTNLADEFSDSEHEALVDSVVILINAFISAGIPLGVVPLQIISEVIEEKVEAYDHKEEEGKLGPETVMEISDSPRAFEDLRTRALLKSDLREEAQQARHNFNLILDTIISVIERTAAMDMAKKEAEK